MKKKIYFFFLAVIAPILLAGYAPSLPDGAPFIDDITEVKLTFTPENGTAITATATDAGSGLVVAAPIQLVESTVYTLSIALKNGNNDITADISSSGENFQFFFVPGEGLFGNGPDYQDFDSGTLPIGLTTGWTGNCVFEDNLTDTFRVVLKDLTGIKSANSTINDGTALFDLSWNMTIVDDPNAPECENEEEIIDKVTLTFTPTGGGNPVVAVASDPDGPGPLDLEMTDIALMESTDYELVIKVENTIEGEDITEEIIEEDEDHLFLFAFGEDIFEDPDGDGNVDNRPDPINYNDQDENGLPVGLSTDWTTACTAEGDVSGTFRVVLKHQPGVKSASSGFEDGGTDIDITWNITVIDNVNAPECENEEEIIDKVTLTFTPTGGGNPVVAVASDPDGPGPLDLQVEDINLVENTTYDMAITVENTIEGEDITEEIMEEDEDHQFYFAWTGTIFSSPTGDGNIDNSAGPVNYNDQDDNGLPVGLSTKWTTNVAMSSGTFRVALKHQPGMKSTTSTFEDGGTDIDITWNVNAVVTSLDNLTEEQELVIAPNPVKNELILLMQNVDLNKANLTIYDAFGKIIRMVQNPTNTIDIQDLADGSYFLTIKGNNLNVTRRFVKLK